MVLLLLNTSNGKRLRNTALNELGFFTQQTNKILLEEAEGKVEESFRKLRIRLFEVSKLPESQLLREPLENH
jgi:hypothetical protein